jgi:hypothetical protein
MITVLVTTTPADAEKYGPGAWLVNSIVDGEVDPYWTIETPKSPNMAHYGRQMAAELHLARTQRNHRVSLIGRASMQDEAEIQAEIDDYDARSYRAELRLIAKG